MVKPLIHPFNFRRSAVALAVGFLTLWASLAVAWAAEVEAKLDRESVPAGNGALLTLSITGGNADQPVIPAVENLIVQPRGKSQNVQIFNGTTTVSAVHNYVVGSNTPGDYVIPAIEVTVDGKKVTTTPLKLKVLASGVAQPPAVTPPASSNTQPANPAQEDSDANRFGFLTVELAANERKHAYVGEIAPVRIRAWLPADSQAGFRGAIQPEGKAFTLHNVSQQGQQSQEIKDGKRYTVVTWFGGISATKAGKYPASLSINATVAMRDPNAAPQPRRRTGGPFDDPFFDSVFDRMNVPMIQKDVTLKSEDQEIEVRALPTEGRPDGFTGAVGKFKLESYQIPPEWKTGEPQSIIATIGGSGNFALMDAPSLDPAAAWKSYRGKDEFTPGDQAAFSGTKSFKFNAVPRKGGEQQAKLTLSYFDPEEAVYKTLTSPPQNVRVSGDDIAEDQAAPPPVPEEKVAKKEVGLIGQKSELAPAVTLVPLISTPAFREMLGVSGIMALCGGVLAAFRNRRSDPQRLAREALEKAARESLAAAGKCAEARDLSGFFNAARLTIQHRLGVMWNQSPQAITTADVQSRVAADSPVLRFFNEADRHEYSRLQGSDRLPQWQALLHEALASLAPPAR